MGIYKEGELVFGRGKIDISIQKTSYATGDTISGSVNLILKKPVRAREVTLSLMGEYTTKVASQRSIDGVTVRARRWQTSDTIKLTRNAGPTYDVGHQTEHVRIHIFKEQLDGEGEYSESRRYEFKIKIPTDTPDSSGVNWYLLAKVDIPHGRDITKKVRMTIR
jgi:sporulation-control protein spo0M